MATTIVSGFSPAGYEEYAIGFVKSFDFYWPDVYKLIIYTEEPIKFQPRKPGQITERSLWVCNGVEQFINQHKDCKQRNGREPHDKWIKRDHRDFLRHGYTYRFEAVRFCRQLFIPEHAASTLPDGDIMVWFDADTYTFDHIPVGWIEGLIGFNDLVTLGRDGASSEIGFWAVTLNERSRAFLKSIGDCYRSGQIFQLNEWHSGYVFDRMAEKAHKNGLTHKSLTDSNNGHVWFQCAVGKYTDHLKGTKRKQLGYSPERFGGGRQWISKTYQVNPYVPNPDRPRTSD